MRDEGVIKFNCHWQKKVLPEPAGWVHLNRWRQRLFSLGLIGVYPDGIGYGNLSLRSSAGTFMITGSQTGSLAELTFEHYTNVVRYSVETNEVFCEGPIRASSESLTHAMIYEQDPSVGAVLHVHHRRLWEKLLKGSGNIPASSGEVPYGTPAMAHEIRRLWKEKKLGEKRILVMAGHEEGVLTFGETPDQAGELLLQTFEKECGPLRGEIQK